MDDQIGEWSDTVPANGDIQELCDQVKHEAEKQTGRAFHEFKACFYRQKNILVLHYIIKVYVGDDYLHLWVTHSFSTREPVIELMGVQQQHKWNDTLKPFNENN